MQRGCCHYSLSHKSMGIYFSSLLLISLYWLVSAVGRAGRAGVVYDCMLIATEDANRSVLFCMTRMRKGGGCLARGRVHFILMLNMSVCVRLCLCTLGDGDHPAVCIWIIGHNEGEQSV